MIIESFMVTHLLGRNGKKRGYMRPEGLGIRGR